MGSTPCPYGGSGRCPSSSVTDRRPPAPACFAPSATASATERATSCAVSARIWLICRAGAAPSYLATPPTATTGKSAPSALAPASLRFFREPRAVLLSHFAHVLRQRKSIPAARHFFEVELPGLGLAMTSPEAVRLFLHRHRDFDACDADNPQTRFASNCPYGPLNEGHLEQAKATFAAMDVVGCTERFEESLMILAQRFGWSELSYHRLNVSHAQENAAEDAALHAELDRHLAFDRQLIARAAERFNHNVAALRDRSRAHGAPLRKIILLKELPPFRRWLHRMSAATTLLLDDWLGWIGAPGRRCSVAS
jgi:hypothetical protein